MTSSSHDWLFHPEQAGWGIVSCRRCGKFDSYRLQGLATTYPSGECNGRSLTSRASLLALKGVR